MVVRGMRGPQRAVGSVLLRILALSTIHKQAAGFVHSPASVVGGCQVAVSRAALCTGRPAPLRRALHLHALAQPNTASNQKVVDVPVKAGTRLSPAIMGLSVVASLLTIKALLVLCASVSRGALLAGASALAGNVGKVCQKRGTQSLPILQLKLPILRIYVANPWWICGFLADIGGALLTVLALSMAPVSVVEPILGSGPGIVAVASFFLTADPLRRSDWAAAALCVFGTVGLGLTAVQSSGAPVVLSLPTVALLLSLFGAAAVASELLHRRRALSAELASSISAGMCFGLSACSTRCGMLLAARLGAIARAVGIAGSVALSGAGFVVQTRGLRAGRAVSVVVFSSLASVLVALLVGILALGEPLPASPTGLALRAASLALLISGSLLLQAGAPRADDGAQAQAPAAARQPPPLPAPVAAVQSGWSKRNEQR